MSNYVRGRRFEYRVKHYYEKKGFYVMRSASSQGICDLIAIGSRHIFLIQCKTGFARMNDTDRRKLIKLAKTHYPLTKPIHAYNVKGKMILEELNIK